MADLLIFESEEDFQIVPIGQEEFHDFSDECQCCPGVTKKGGKYAYVHKEFNTEFLMHLAYHSPYYNFKQKYNC